MAVIQYRLYGLALLALLALVGASGPRRMGGRRQAEVVKGRPSTVNCTWSTFEQKIDHFGDAVGTFPQRICTYSAWWGKAADGGFHAAADAPGPILFYTGNESPVEEYINNTGLMWELGEQMGALLVFAEHRYEPLSHPALCGADAPQKCFAYCTTAQANADWAAIITDLRTQHAIRAPAVALGGSYGGMLAGWFRMKYPDVVDGAIAASAPIWQLAGTVELEDLDLQSVAITRGVSAVGGATDQCRDNLRAAWPLLQEVGRSPGGLSLLGESVKACSPLANAGALSRWAQTPFFYMAEGNYPFPSTYITYSILPGDPTPLPAWPMRVACEGLNRDFGIHLDGSVRDVKYTLEMGAIKVAVDWRDAKGNGAGLTSTQIRESGILELASAVADAAGVWYNLTKDKECFPISPPKEEEPQEIKPEPLTPAVLRAVKDGQHQLAAGVSSCPVCPPCDDCPPCPVSYCDVKDTKPCTYKKQLSKGFSWQGIFCNEALSQIERTGLGRDMFWPPNVASRKYTMEDIVGPHGLRKGGCTQYESVGLQGAPIVSDLWSTWINAYYGGRNVSHHRNIVWSNGALDPWSGQGVYPPGGGPEAGQPMVQNISADGSQIALVLDLGAHHLDLMFTHENNPPCFAEARKIETRMIRQWFQEAYDTHPTATAAADNAR